MAKKYSIFTAFTAKDGVSAAFNKMAGGANKFAKSAGSAFSRVTKRIKKMATVAGGNLIASGVRQGLALISGGIREVTSQFIGLDDAIFSAGAKFKDINLSTAAGRDRMNELRKAARLAGKETIFSAVESAKGLEFLAMAGFSSAQAMASLKTIQDLSIATNTEFAQAADMSSDLLLAFGLAAEDATTQGKNFTRLNDVLTKTANSANVTLETMFETMKVAAPIARTYGLSLEEVAAVTGVLGSAGIKGSIAATSLKNIMLKLAAPGSKAVGMLNDLGVKVADADGNMRKITDVIGEVGFKMKGMGTQKQLKIFNEIFGKRAIAGASNIANLVPEIVKMKTVLEGASGAAAETAAQMSESLGRRLLLLKNASVELGLKILDAFAGDGRKGIDTLIERVREFDVTGIIEGIRITVNLLKSISPIIMTIGRVLNPVLLAFNKFFDFVSFMIDDMTVLMQKITRLIPGLNLDLGRTEIKDPFLRKRFEEEKRKEFSGTDDESIVAPNKEREESKRQFQRESLELGRGTIDVSLDKDVLATFATQKGSNFQFNESLAGAN